MGQLRAVLAERTPLTQIKIARTAKPLCIDLLIEHDTPFPECQCIQWNFMLKCAYEGYDTDRMEGIKTYRLADEVQRLGIAKPTVGRMDLMDSILNFIKNKGVGHQPAIQSSPDRGCIHWRSIGEVRAKRKAISDPTRPNFNIGTTNKVLIIIIVRHSDGPQAALKAQKEEEDQTLLDSIESILKTKDIIKGIERGEYLQFKAIGCKLTDSIPVSRLGLFPDSWKSKFIDHLEQAQPGTKVLIVASGVDGLPTDLSGWTQFHGKFQARRGLDITIVFSETSKQWRGANIAWRGEDWMGPVCERFWALCPLEDLINTQRDTPLASDIREQWERCRDGRVSYSQAHVVQQRPAAGRNRLPRES